MAQGTATKVKKRKKSVLKRAAQSLRLAEINRGHRTRVRSSLRSLRGALRAGDAAAAGALLRPTLSAIDRAVAKGRPQQEFRQSLQVAAVAGLQRIGAGEKSVETG